MLANPAFLRYDSQARVRKTGIFCPFAGAYDCTICDDAGGCGSLKPVFPLSMSDFKPGEKRNVDLTHLPLAEHDVVYIRFPECEGRSGYQRTLIYDTDECQCTMHGMIVDYGDKNYDVKLVKIG